MMRGQCSPDVLEEYKAVLVHLNTGLNRASSLAGGMHDMRIVKNKYFQVKNHREDS